MRCNTTETQQPEITSTTTMYQGGLSCHFRLGTGGRREWQQRPTNYRYLIIYIYKVFFFLHFYFLSFLYFVCCVVFGRMKLSERKGNQREKNNFVKSKDGYV